MISFLKKVWRDRRGNALVIAGAALPLVIGSAGLATDTIQWSLWKRQLQRAADSAALAGAYAEASGNSVDTGNCLTSTANSAHPIRFDLQKNDHSGIVTSCTASNPPSTGAYTADGTAVHVALQGSKALSFSGMFMTSAPTISVSATAKLIDDGDFCLVTLKRDSGAGITMSGSSTANLGCGAISNSTGTSSITSNGNAYSFTADPVASVGGMPQSINGSTNLEPYHLPQSDPFAGKYPTDIPSGTSCKSSNQQSYGSHGSKLKAGCYTDFHLTGQQTYTMDPGIYYLNSTDFNIGGGVTLIGTGVTIILTGSTPGSVQINGNSTIQLSAQTSGTYAHMLFLQAPGATADSTFNGTNSSYFDGALYFPNTNVTFNGTSGASTQCTMVVSYTATFAGNTNLQNSLTRPDNTPCQNNTTVHAHKIALVE